MESNEQDIVGQQHEPRKLISYSALAKSVIPEIANVFDLGMLHNEFVHGHRSNPEQDASDDHDDDSWNPSQD